MVSVIGARFKTGGKIYFFDPGDESPNISDRVLVETSKGRELAEVIMPRRDVSESSVVMPLKPIIRLATEEDLQHDRELREKEKEAFAVCQNKIAEHKLDMKLVRSEISPDNSKIMFYFTANGRVDFRALVKDLASVFHSRIELRQIGVRDEARMLGGMGPCGRHICCDAFLKDFEPVSIKMAKEQKLSLNPTKISGVCGRLMCCLKYEEEQYEEVHKRMPKLGKEIQTPDGFGIVTDQNVLKETVTCRFNRGENSDIKEYTLESLVDTGVAKPYIPPAQTLQIRQEEQEIPEDKIEEDILEVDEEVIIAETLVIDEENEDKSVDARMSVDLPKGKGHNQDHGPYKRKDQRKEEKNGRVKAETSPVIKTVTDSLTEPDHPTEVNAAAQVRKQAANWRQQLEKAMKEAEKKHE